MVKQNQMLTVIQEQNQMMLSNRMVGEGGFLKVDNWVLVCLAYKTKKEKRQLRRRLEAELALKIEYNGSTVGSWGNGANNDVGKLKRVHSKVGSVIVHISFWLRTRPHLLTDQELKRHRKNNGEFGIGFGMRSSPSKVFKSCSLLLDKLINHSYGWLFNDPVEMTTLG
ncbi:hypothetical protein Cgig2_027994 [Carnegiea gigantea]|uniref:Uncharacterized protein n=1 Tax=Carnegiea gigantea TaxID=171969 RepID=A0A9Q1JMT4_9CARY|nr:hypothetical protein Cgig2_027994 [Carnegiea gigantea]